MKNEREHPKVFIGKYSKFIYQLETLLNFIDWNKIIKLNDRVVIKPNFTFPKYKKGVTTSPQLLEELVKIIKTRTSNIIIGEGEGGYNVFSMDEAFINHGKLNLVKRYGVKFENFSKSESVIKEIKFKNKIIKIPLPATIIDNSDVFISIPVPKIHAMTKVSLGYKNQWGCISDPLRILYHYLFHEGIIQINNYLKPQIVLGDANFMLDINGPMNGVPIHRDVIIASNNIGAFDRVCCEFMNINYNEIKHLYIAKKKGKIPKMSELTLNDTINNFKSHHFTLKRTIKNWGALLAFESKLLSKLFYHSRISGLFHRILWKVYGHPIQ